MAPALWAPDFSARLAAQLERLSSLGVYMPGRQPESREIEIADSLAAMLEDGSNPARGA